MKLSDYAFVMSILLLVGFDIWERYLYEPPIEPFVVEFQRPVGGENREVEKVSLSCAIGADEALWCQETVLDIWSVD